MITDKIKNRNIYNYLSMMAKAHKSSEYKYRNWSQYYKYDKKHCFSVQEHNWRDETAYRFDLYDIDFTYKDNFWVPNGNHERIHISLNIEKDFSKLNITECMVKDGSGLVSFFNRLDNFMDGYEENESFLEEILTRKSKGYDE